MTKKKELEKEIGKLKESMQEFRKGIETIHDNCEKNNLKWLRLASKNMLNVIDEHIKELDEQ